MEDIERPVLSRDAVEALRAELEELRTDGRQKMAERLLAARELGDVSDSAEFESAKQDQGLLEGKIIRLETLLKEAVVRDEPVVANAVIPGVAVTVRDADDPSFEETYVLGESEERITGVSVLSVQSPLGQALLGKRPGDRVTYSAPGGTFTYEVVKLQPA
jgi:transcription elongation factor GreA